MALLITDHMWSIGELLNAAIAVSPRAPTETAPDQPTTISSNTSSEVIIHS
jgi:hypothetical protein